MMVQVLFLDVFSEKDPHLNAVECRLNTNLFPESVKLIEYFASAVNVVSSNPWVGPLPRIKIYFPVLSTFTDELISAPKIITFFP